MDGVTAYGWHHIQHDLQDFQDWQDTPPDEVHPVIPDLLRNDCIRLKTLLKCHARFHELYGEDPQDA